MRASVRGVAARWRRQSTGQRTRQAVAGLLLLLALVAWPLWGWLDPRMPVSALYHLGSPVDPWGSPWPQDVLLGLSSASATHSLGPDRREGAGDDVTIVGGPFTQQSALLPLYLALPGLLLGLSLALAVTSRPVRPPSAFTEALRCALMALPSAGVALLAACAVTELAPGFTAAVASAASGWLLVPLPLAAVLVCYGLALLLVVGARAGRPRADELGA